LAALATALAALAATVTALATVALALALDWAAEPAVSVAPVAKAAAGWLPRTGRRRRRQWN
jgi:hypothetical protein